MSESLELGRGWSLRVLSHGVDSVVGEVQFAGVTRADVLGATRRGDIARACVRLRPGVRFELAGSIGGFDVREIAAQAAISMSDYPQQKSSDEVGAVDLEILVALQDALAKYLGGPVVVTPVGPDSDEPLVIVDLANDVRPNRPST